MYALIIPISSILKGSGENAALKNGTLKFLSHTLGQKILIGLLVQEPYETGKVTMARMFRLLGRKKLPFDIVVYNECIDPISVAEHHFRIKGRTVAYTTLPFAVRVCECGKLVWPNYVRVKRVKKKVSREKRWLCECGMSHIEKNM